MNLFRRFILGSILLALTACGGSGDSGSVGTASGTTVNPNAPIAFAGYGQMVPIRAVAQLNGSPSYGVTGKALSYRWTLSSKPNGSSSALVASNTATPFLIPDVVGTYVVSLVVSDGILSSAPSSISLIAVPGSTAAIANAGTAQTVQTLATVQLNGTASSGVSGNALNYSWTLSTRPVGSNASLNFSQTATPTFVADVSGTYVATLTVKDGTLTSQPSLVTIVADAKNLTPVANPGGAQNVSTGATVQLTSSVSSSTSANALGYSWTLLAKPTGSAAALSSRTVANPSFIADVSGVYVATLTVNDGALFSVPVSTVITASASSTAPLANAGAAQTGFTGVKVNLDAGLSQSMSGNPLSYKWALTTRPAGSTTQLGSFEMVRTNFVPDVSGIYTATLVVNDGKLSSQPSTVQIDIAPSVLTLWTVDAGLGNQVQSWPYTHSTAIVGTVNCAGGVCSDFTVGNFQLQATGRSVTIANVAAVDLTTNTNINAYFLGLKDGQVIAGGQAAAFQLLSQATSGQTIHLLYTFSIVETGDVFSFDVSLKTN